MGDRRNVIVKESDSQPRVSLYTHWYGSELPGIVARALDRGRGRWGDTSYLTRIIFSQMVSEANALLEETGFGIEAVKDDDARTEASPGYDLLVDEPSQSVRIDNKWYSYEDFIDKFK